MTGLSLVSIRSSWTPGGGVGGEGSLLSSLLPPSLLHSLLPSTQPAGWAHSARLDFGHLIVHLIHPCRCACPLLVGTDTGLDLCAGLPQQVGLMLW